MKIWTKRLQRLKAKEKETSSEGDPEDEGAMKRAEERVPKKCGVVVAIWGMNQHLAGR